MKLLFNFLLPKHISIIFLKYGLMKNAELQLEDKDYGFDDILKNHPIGNSILIMELDGTVISFNKDAADLIHSINENTLIKSKNFIKLFNNKTEHLLRDKLHQINNKENIKFFLFLNNNQANDIYLEIIIKNIVIKRFNKACLLAIIKDQTAYNRLENKLWVSEIHLNTAQQTAKIGSWEMEFLNNQEKDWQFTYFSKEARRIWGFENGNSPLFVMDLYKNMLNDDGYYRNDHILKCIKLKQDFEMENKMATKEGEIRYICEKGEIIYNNEIPVKIIGTCQDVTEKTESYLNLKEYKEKLKAVFDSSFNDYYLLLNPLKEVMFFNKNIYIGLYRYYGKIIKVGDQINDIIDSDDLTDFYELFNKCLKGEPSKVEFKFKPLKKTSIWLDVNFNPVYSDHILIGIAINIIDITFKKNDELALIKKNKALRNYAFYTSHKLRAPLSNILGISILINQIDTTFGNNDYLKELTKNIQEEAQVLDQIVHHLNDIVSVAHPKIHKNKLKTTDLRHIVLIDDDPVVNIINVRLFKNLNKEINCYVFVRANEALTYILSNPVDLILLDINMPIMNGWQFLEEMKNKKLKIEVLMVSSSIDPEDLKRALSYENVFSFLSKPIKIEDLKELMV